ncbi:MAG: Valine--tRNA ligase [candidate division TA06 bacterium ADurb.Bin131]|uniref:Valine--tRNA ligase n=1 Tax=candidate division TA06 bacterium ADurb.Bin131 TaxID=1852827 RepID=A0A1V6C4H2_UNCT6|nr:MAG: Valine--tRNA ligase [candidate division TA06 bacterium ADurb.Bin131]HOC01964.1 valine--tRNA ligase [bacterium]HQL64540.1 valine--tRNA ligase [bacterium]
MEKDRYHPKEIEQYWYQKWEESGCFRVDRYDGEPYVIVIPPPNITGYLHIGHALNNTIQDILIRWKRMQGFNALWVPGTDHAGIATQNVVEKELMKKGLSRESLGREKFLKEVWSWREKYGNRIIEQLKRLGASCDWSRLRFTMDENFSRAVQTVFVSLYEKGFIYRGTRIINWCPRCTTALSDEEVEYREEDGYLYYLRYPVEGNGFVVVATTRPETMLGDTAVAVHPEDTRYKGLIGKMVNLPFVDRLIPIIADENVEREFGTGAVKVTPSHDPQDYNIARRHNLQFITVMDTTGKMNENAVDFAGLDRFSCREKILQQLQEKNLVEKIEPYTHRVGHCYRCDTVIEPYISRQWFVKMKDLSIPAIKVVVDGDLKFYPERWTKVYLQWLDNIQDWCISRQIWWGHRIPVWYCANEKCPPIVSIEIPVVCPCCGCDKIVQDPDVLDTWFSSWLWPFAVFGWPEKTKDLEIFYPTDTLVTAQEILFFWVARMVMAGFEFMGEKPFSSVYINGTVRDETGRKMSKSLGNAIDPVEIIDESGADSLRFGLISLTSFGQDVFLPDKFYYKGRNFLNKIWNSFRYLEILAEKNQVNKISFASVIENAKGLHLQEKWILTLLDQNIRHICECLENFKFNEASDCIYEFFWHQYCDWYIEMSKMYSEKDQYLVSCVIPSLFYVMEKVLKLLHPFVPFITEELWHHLQRFVDVDADFITKSSWPRPYGFNFEETLENMEEIKNIVIEIRDVKTGFRIPVNQNVDVDYYGILLLSNDEYRKIVEFLAKVKFNSKEKNSIKNIPDGEIVKIWGNGWFSMKTEGVIDFEAEKKKLIGERDKIMKIFEGVENKLSSDKFLTHAPEDVIEKTKKLRDELKYEIEKIEKNLKLLTREQ